MQDINEAYNFCGFLANKIQSGSITPDNFNLIIGVANTQYFRLKLGLPEMYTVEKREAPQEIQVTQAINDTLRPFIKSATLAKTGNGFSLPADFAAFVPSGYLYVTQVNGQNSAVQQPIDFVNMGERGIRLNNYITYPTLEYPICTYIDNQLVAEPKDIESMTLYYYRYPKTPFRGYTINANDQDVYDPTSPPTQQIEFPNLEWENICHIAVKYWATMLREQELYSIEQSRIFSGQ